MVGYRSGCIWQITGNNFPNPSGIEMNRLHCLKILGILFFLAGCTAPMSMTDIAPTTRVSTKMTPSARMRITETPSSTKSTTHSPSPTLTATRTVNPTFAYMETWLSVDLPATLAARFVSCDDGFELGMYAEILRFSSDSWTIYTCSPHTDPENIAWTPGTLDFGTRYTRVVKTDGSVSWTIRHDRFDYSVIDRPDALLKPYLWTNDGRFVYVYPMYYPGPGGFKKSVVFYSFIPDLYRLNLETGAFELVLSGSEFNDIAISPDGRLMIYSEYDDPDMIHVVDMENGAGRTVSLDLDVMAAGSFLISDDQTQVLFMAGFEKTSDNWQDDVRATSIFLLNVEDMHLKTLLAEDPRLLVLDTYHCEYDQLWPKDQRICLSSLNFDDEGIYTLNLVTSKIRPLSTPGP